MQVAVYELVVIDLRFGLSLFLVFLLHLSYIFLGIISVINC